MKSRSFIGHTAMLLAIVCFGLMAPLCKLIYENSAIRGLDLASFRMLGAACLFWLVSLFLPPEPIKKGDGKNIFLASLAGTLFSQGLYTYGIQYTSPTNSTIIVAMIPIFILLLSAVVYKTKISLLKAAGVLTGFSGVLLLVFGGGTSSTGNIKGDAICLLSQFVAACYFTFFCGTIIKYSPITFMKWMFLIGGTGMLLINGANLLAIDYSALTSEVRWAILYVVIMATFVAYQLMFMGQKYLSPELVGMYTYPQPFIAAVFAIFLGLDVFAWFKIIAAILIIVGVYIVNKSKQRENLN